MTHFAREETEVGQCWLAFYIFFSPLHLNLQYFRCSSNKFPKLRFLFIYYDAFDGRTVYVSKSLCTLNKRWTIVTLLTGFSRYEAALGIMANACLFFELDVTIFGHDGGVLS